MSYTFPHRTGTLAWDICAESTPHQRACLNDPASLPTVKEARYNEPRTMRLNNERSRFETTGTYVMVLMANDDVACCYFGIRGGFKVVWNFGQEGGAA